jgi:hypothetical protein
MTDPARRAPFTCHWCGEPFSHHRMSDSGDVLCPVLRFEPASAAPAQQMAAARNLYQPWAFEPAPAPAAPAVYEEPPRLLLAVGRLER